MTFHPSWREYQPASELRTLPVHDAKRQTRPRHARARVTLPLDEQCRLAGLPVPVPEHRFHLTRRWRFDWAWPARMVALEVDGGIFVGGRHSRGAGMLGDMEKLNAATEVGWRVVRVTPAQVRSGAAVALLTPMLRDGA